MVTLIIILLVLGAVWATVATANHLKGLEEQHRLDRERAQRAQEALLRVLGDELTETYGYLVRRVVSEDELEVLVRGGKSEAEVRRIVLDRCDRAEGLVLGVQDVGEDPAYVKLPATLRTRHVYIIGRSGAGKTNLIRNCILQDLEAGHGFAVLAPEQELITDEILPFVPERRIGDVIYVNPSDTRWPVSFNPLHAEPGEDLDLKADELIDIFQQVFADIGAGSAPRLESILQHAIHTLLLIPGSTLLDMERLLSRSDRSFRQWAAQMTADERLKRFWLERYETFPRDAHHSVLNRLDRLLRSQVMRATLCSHEKPFSFREAMDDGQVVLINLSDGILGAGNALLLGQIIVAKIQTAVMSRANLPKGQRRPYSVYLDEFQTFCGVASSSYERILSRARKYGLGMVLAHQQSGQIPDSLMREILGNVSTIIAFQVGARDAARMGRELIVRVPTVTGAERRPLSAAALQHLPVGHAWGKIDRTVFRMRTRRAPANGSPEVRDEVIRSTRERLARGGGSLENVVPLPRGDGKRVADPGSTASDRAARGDRWAGVDPGEVF